MCIILVRIYILRAYSYAICAKHEIDVRYKCIQIIVGLYAKTKWEKKNRLLR